MALVVHVELGGAVDGPMAEGTEAGQPERGRDFRVVEAVADHCFGGECISTTLS